MRYPRKPLEPGEWQTDEQGKKYRMIGGVKEYEMTIRIDGIEIPQSELEDYNKRKKAAAAAKAEAEKNKPAPPPRKFCPFQSGLTTDCDGEKCALYLNGCTLAQLSDEPPAKATEGMGCPFSAYHICRKDCALFKATGCALTAIKKARTTNNE